MAPSKTCYGNGGKGEKKLEKNPIRFPLGNLTENGVLTPNDKTHQAGCLALESHYSLNPFPLCCSLTMTGSCVCVCVGVGVLRVGVGGVI